MIYKIIFFILISQNLFGIEKDTKKYDYIKLKECDIPILKKFKLIEQLSPYEYSYNYCMENTLICSQISITNNTEKEFYNFITKIKQSLKNYKVLLNYQYKGYLIYIIENSFKELSYAVYHNGTMIILLNNSQKEVDYLIDYCEQTKN